MRRAYAFDELCEAYAEAIAAGHWADAEGFATLAEHYWQGPGPTVTPLYDQEEDR